MNKHQTKILFPEELRPLLTNIEMEFSNVWQLNDPAHRSDHFDAVFWAGCHINNTLKLGIDEKLILLTAYFHDLFAWSRHNHHHMSAEFVMTSDHPIFQALSYEERRLVAVGCREHRASRTDPFTNLFGELMNSADRMFPDVTGIQIFERSFHCSSAKNTEAVQVNVELALIHIKEKYGTGGYARLPDMYHAVFGELINQQQKAIDALEYDQAFSIIMGRYEKREISDKAIIFNQILDINL